MKIGLISFAAKVNCYDIAQQYLERTNDFLKQSGHEIECVAKVVLDPAAFQNAVEQLHAAEPELIVMEIGSFTPGEMMVDFAQSFRNTAFFLRGYNDPIVESHHTIPLNSMTGLLMATSFFHRLQIPFDWAYGDAEDEACREKLMLTVNAVAARAKLRGRKYAVIGSRAPGFYLSGVDELRLRRQIGPQIEYCSLADILARAQAMPAQRVQEKVGQLLAKAPNPILSEQAFEKSARLLLAVTDHVSENRIDAVTMKCWPELQQLYGCAGCSTLSELNDMGVPACCEGDIPGLITMDVLHMFTGKSPFFADLVCRNTGAGLKAWHCGFGPFSLADDSGDACFIEQATMRGGIGAGHQYTMKRGRVTMCRFSEQPDGYKLFAAAGCTQSPDRKILGVQTDIQLDAGFDKVFASIVENGLEQHFAIVHGDLCGQLRVFSKWMGMRYVEEKAGEAK